MTVDVPLDARPVSTPVLIGVGAGGIPGEQAQADHLYTGLRRFGKPAELRKYDRMLQPFQRP